MTKFIGIKELQQNTKKIREEVEKGVRFIVIYRSKPVFEIKPLDDSVNFVSGMKATELYTDDFLERMAEAQGDVNKGNLKEYSVDDFMKTL